MGIFGRPNPLELRCKDNVDGLIKLLKYKDPKIRKEAARELSYTKSFNLKAVDALIETLESDPDMDARSGAALTFSTRPHSKAINALVNCYPHQTWGFSALGRCLQSVNPVSYKIEDETLNKIKLILDDLSNMSDYGSQSDRNEIIIGLKYLKDMRVAPIFADGYINDDYLPVKGNALLGLTELGTAGLHFLLKLKFQELSNKEVGWGSYIKSLYENIISLTLNRGQRDEAVKLLKHYHEKYGLRELFKEILGWCSSDKEKALLKSLAREANIKI